MLTAYYSRTKNKEMQTLYQSPERLVEIYKCFNFDFSEQAGLVMVVPFKVKKWLDSASRQSAFVTVRKTVISGISRSTANCIRFIDNEQYLHSFHQTRFEVYSKRILSEQGDTRHFRPSPFGKSGCGPALYFRKGKSTTDLEMRRHI